MSIGECNIDLDGRKSAFRILFISPASLEFTNFESGRPTAISHSPNLSLSFLYHWLKMKFADRVDIRTIEQVNYNIPFEDMPEVIRTFDPHLVGITSSTFNLLGAYRIARTVKETSPECTTVLGGAHATVLPVHTLKECGDIDICVCGEGELTMEELVEHLMSGGSTDEMRRIKGIAYRSDEGRVVQTPSRPVIDDLDILPHPTYEEYDMNRIDYRFCPITNKNEIYFSVFSSRGCVFKCAFCTPVLPRKFRYRSPAKVIEEIRYLREKFGAEVIYFEDSCMSTNKNWFSKVCDDFISSGLSSEVRWGFETRVDLVEPELMRKAVRAGCIFVNFGLESGSDLVLKMNRKGFTKDTILKSLKITRESGVQIIHGSFILGLPYETSGTVEETMEFIDKVDLNMIPINVADVYPGTEFFRMVDRGDGGLRWIPGQRMNWEAYRRDTLMTEVNDLDKDRLLDYYRKILDKVERKTSIRYSI